MLIKYIKSVLWKVVKRLSYIEDAQCLKVKGRQPYPDEDTITKFLPFKFILAYVQATPAKK